MAVLNTCEFKEFAIRTKGSIPKQGISICDQFDLHVRSTQGQIRANLEQGQATLRQIVQYGPNSNLYENLCLSWKIACLNKL